MRLAAKAEMLVRLRTWGGRSVHTRVSLPGELQRPPIGTRRLCRPWDTNPRKSIANGRGSSLAGPSAAGRRHRVPMEGFTCLSKAYPRSLPTNRDGLTNDPFRKLRRMICILSAILALAYYPGAGAVTVLVDAAWAQAGIDSAGDRCINDLLLNLKAGDRFELLTTKVAAQDDMNRLVRFKTHRRPAVRRAELLATRRVLNEVLAGNAPATWPSLAQALARAAALPNPDTRLDRRVIVVGALSAAEPPAVDPALQRLLRARRIIIVDLARLDPTLHEARLTAWRRFFATAGAGPVTILTLSDMQSQ